MFSNRSPFAWLMLPLLASMLRVDDRYAAAQENSRRRRTHCAAAAARGLA